MRIHTIDLEFQGRRHAIASYLVEAPEGPILVETGPGSTLSELKSRVVALGFEPEQIRHIFLTHIHLDHAGAAGWWAEQGATVYVHPNGAPHLIDPSRLIRSATRIYGDEMESLWGAILPAPAEQVVEVKDGTVIEAAGMKVRAWDTPGHASHHIAYQMAKVLFTGDVAGIRIPEFSWIDLPAPPPEFDLELWKASLRRIREIAPTHLLPTHFGPTKDVEEQLAGVERRLDESVSMVQRLLDAGLDRDAIVDRYNLWIRELIGKAGGSEQLADLLEIANPKTMSVDGILRYLNRRTG